MKPFIIYLGAIIFNVLRWISPFQIVRTIFPSTRRNHGFVEIWVLGHVIGALLCLLISSVSQIQWWEILLLVYAGFRIFEIIIYQINVLLFDQYRVEKAGKIYALGSYRRIIILLIFNYIEILLWFALFYRNFTCMFASKHILLNSFSGSLYYSIVTMSTLGYGDILPINNIGLILTSTQTLIGIFIVLLILARFISLLPRPETLEDSEKNRSE